MKKTLLKSGWFITSSILFFAALVFWILQAFFTDDLNLIFLFTAVALTLLFVLVLIFWREQYKIKHNPQKVKKEWKNLLGCSIIYLCVPLIMAAGGLFVKIGNLITDHVKASINEHYENSKKECLSKNCYNEFCPYWDRRDHECYMYTLEQADSIDLKITLDSILNTKKISK